MADLQQLLQGQMGPDVMAIGASVFNGVRSATITRALAEKAAPVQVARQMGWRIVTPDYPRPVLLDLEDLIRRIISGQQKLNLAEIHQQVRANAEAWLADLPQGWSTQIVFDNIAIAQAGIEDLVTVNAGALKAAIPGLVDQLRQGTGRARRHRHALFLHQRRVPAQSQRQAGAGRPLVGRPGGAAQAEMPAGQHRQQRGAVRGRLHRALQRQGGGQDRHHPREDADAGARAPRSHRRRRVGAADGVDQPGEAEHRSPT